MSRFSLISLVIFTLACILPRVFALQANFLLFDDFVVINRQGMSAWTGDNRIILSVVAHFFDWVLPGFYATNIPKYIAMIGMVVAAVFFNQFLIKNNVNPLWSCACVMMFLLSPVINGLLLWNVTFAIPFVLALSIGAYLLIDRGGRTNLLCGFILLSIVSLGYQSFLAIPMIMALAQFGKALMIDRTWDWKILLSVAFVLVGAFLVYLFYASVVAPDLIGVNEKRGFVGVMDPREYLGQKIQGTLNGILNLYLPVFAYHIGVQKAMQLWEYIPMALMFLSIAVLSCSKLGLLRSFIFVGVSYALIPIAGLPGWLAESYPEAWRTSSPMMMAQIICIAFMAIPLAAQTRFLSTRFVNIVSASIFCILGGLLFMATNYDAQMRSKSYSMDVNLIKSIEQYWANLGVEKDQFNIYFHQPKPDRIKLPIPFYSLTVANRTIMSYSVFRDGPYARDFLYLNGFQVMFNAHEIFEGEHILGIDELPLTPIVKHYPEQKISLIQGVRHQYSWH